MPEEKKFHWCWDKCQYVDRKACESRIQKGKCHVLSEPKGLSSEVQGALHKEKGEIKIECEEI